MGSFCQGCNLAIPEKLPKFCIVFTVLQYHKHEHWTGVSQPYPESIHEATFAKITCSQIWLPQRHSRTTDNGPTGIRESNLHFNCSVSTRSSDLRNAIRDGPSSSPQIRYTRLSGQHMAAPFVQTSLLNGVLSGAEIARITRLVASGHARVFHAIPAPEIYLLKSFKPLSPKI